MSDFTRNPSVHHTNKKKKKFCISWTIWKGTFACILPQVHNRPPNLLCNYCPWFVLHNSASISLKLKK